MLVLVLLCVLTGDIVLTACWRCCVLVLLCVLTGDIVLTAAVVSALALLRAGAAVCW